MKCTSGTLQLSDSIHAGNDQRSAGHASRKCAFLQTTMNPWFVTHTFWANVLKLLYSVGQYNRSGLMQLSSAGMDSSENNMYPLSGLAKPTQHDLVNCAVLFPSVALAQCHMHQQHPTSIDKNKMRPVNLSQGGVLLAHCTLFATLLVLLRH